MPVYPTGLQREGSDIGQPAGSQPEGKPLKGKGIIFIQESFLYDHKLPIQMDYNGGKGTREVGG